ncbi:prepilin-type N-terminal cleavage/methylation domain-containing protein [Cyanobium sp. T1G-Tous]|uniref:prepilin-type N-terminal cleavage/methylation domain-containing protein n=1 Tax=Cyanobium sp. T1G-Tous TaxID=2823722 RepID=UPI0020CEA2E7|nr:prepilin-type N-terminal cleavage/methylation domain-containing protein [Cyanobium sp. T1G-Tous]
MSGLVSRFRRPLLPFYCRPKPTDLGFTLVELLVGLVIAGVVASAAGAVMVAQIQSSAKLELAQRQRDNSSRLDYLIQIEAGEAASVIVDPSIPASCSSTGVATGVAGFRIPRDRGQYLNAANTSFVYYYNKGSDVWRCGPPVKRSGVLNHDSSVLPEAGVAVRDARLEKVNCSGQVTNEGQFVYRLVFPTGYQPACSVARAKTLQICNVVC